MIKKNILILNGSLGKDSGNTSVIIERAQTFLSEFETEVQIIHLAKDDLKNNLEEKLNWADAFIFTSGTYWDSWGSPMQLFLETLTEFEGSTCLLFKPAAVLISMHSVGGKSVLSRLQGVLNTMGLLIPPMSGFVYALTSHLALDSKNNSFHDDFWSLEDLEIIVHNLVTAANKQQNFKSWPIDHKDPKRRWL
jgi:NAD(P)H-dependent FMN reductase